MQWLSRLRQQGARQHAKGLGLDPAHRPGSGAGMQALQSQGLDKHAGSALCAALAARRPGGCLVIPPETSAPSLRCARVRAQG